MKRFTFSVMLALATIVAHAENAAPTWTANLTTTEKATDLKRGAAMTIDNEGNAIVTGTYTKELEFASSYLESIATSAFIAKYDKAGNKKWAAGLKGAATITTITNDAEGNVYAAGVFADKVAILNSKGEAKENITGMADQKDQVSGFIVKYNKEGEYVASKVVIPQVNPSIAEMDFLGLAPASFYSKKLVVDGSTLYLSAAYCGDVNIDNVALSGKYSKQVEADFAMYSNASSMCVLSFNVSDLSNTKIVSYLGAKEQTTENAIYNAEDINFDVHDGKVYVGYVASGKELTLYAGNNSYPVELKYEEGGNIEHGYVFAMIDGNDVKTKVYNSEVTDATTLMNSIDQMVYKNGNLYIAGTFNIAHPLDNKISFKGGCDTYAACIDATNLEKKWIVASDYDEQDPKHKAEVVTGMAVNNDEIHLTGWAEQTNGHVVETPLNFYIDTEAVPSKMTIKTGDDAIFATSVAHNNIYTIAQKDNRTKVAEEDAAKEGIYTYSFYNDGEDTGVKQLTANGNTISWNGNTITLAKAADIELYTASGMLVKKANNASSMSLQNVAAGIYMVKAGKQTIKIVK